MLEVLAVANSAFAIIKQTVMNGKDLASCLQQIGTFVGAEDRLRQEVERKRNSLWTRFLGKEDNELEEFMALEQIRTKQNELRELMQLYGRVNLYSDYIAYCAEVRKKKIQAQKDAAKKREEFKDLILKIILGILLTAAFCGVITLLVIIAKKKGII